MVASGPGHHTFGHSSASEINSEQYARLARVRNDDRRFRRLRERMHQTMVPNATDKALIQACFEGGALNHRAPC